MATKREEYLERMKLKEQTTAILLKIPGNVRVRPCEEIKKLHQKLIDANIAHEFVPYYGGYGITLWSDDGNTQLASVIEHDMSYGFERDLLEFCDTSECFLDPEGFLTATEVYDRITAILSR